MTTRLEMPVLAQLFAEPIVRKREDQRARKGHIVAVGGHRSPPLDDHMVTVHDGLAEAEFEVALVPRLSSSIRRFACALRSALETDATCRPHPR